MRVDTTVVETNIHHPTDSTLLGDGVRVLIRTMKKITEIVGAAGTKLRDRSRSVKLRLLEIARTARAKGPLNHERLKRGLSQVTELDEPGGGSGEALLQRDRRRREAGQGRLEATGAEGLRQELEAMLPLVRQVMRQTRARIFRGDTRAEGKLVSVFEPSTEIIRKGKAGKPNEFGKMVKLQEAENQIVIDYEVYDQRPSDSDLLIPAIEIHQAKLGRTPRLVAADAGVLLRQERGGGESEGRQTRLHSQSLHQKRRAQARAEEALVPQRPEMAHRMRGAHQRGQAAARARSLPLQGQHRNEALGRARRRRRQPHQHRPRDGKAVTPTVVRSGSISASHRPAGSPGGLLSLSTRLTDLFRTPNFAPESSYNLSQVLDQIKRSGHRHPSQ